MDSDTIKAAVASYWRYTKQCHLVALEASSWLKPFNYGGQADILAVTKRRHLVETEVKVSLADMRRDKSKRKHTYYKQGSSYYPTQRFFFAVPKEIANAACLLCGQLFPYAGVLGSDGTDGWGVEIYRPARLLNGTRLTFPQILRMTREQSATVCRLSMKVAQQKEVISRLRVLQKIKELP